MPEVLRNSLLNPVQSVQGVKKMRQRHVEEKWVPKTSFLASLMTEARRLAEI